MKKTISLFVIALSLVSIVSAGTSELFPSQGRVTEGYACTPSDDVQHETEELKWFDRDITTRACSCNAVDNTWIRYEYTLPSNIVSLQYHTLLSGDYGTSSRAEILCGNIPTSLFTHSGKIDYRLPPKEVNISIPLSCREGDKLVLWQKLLLVCGHGGELFAQCNGDCQIQEQTSIIRGGTSVTPIQLTQENQRAIAIGGFVGLLWLLLRKKR